MAASYATMSLEEEEDKENISSNIAPPSPAPTSKTSEPPTQNQQQQQQQQLTIERERTTTTTTINDGSSGDSSSGGGGSGDGVVSVVISEMEEEECRLEEENREEEERIAKSLRENQQDTKEQRYKRLMHLLTKSQFYSEFLLQEIETQKQQQQQEQQQQERNEVKIESSCSSQSDDSQKEGKRKRGRRGGGGGKKKKRKQDFEMIENVKKDIDERKDEEEEEEEEAKRKEKQPKLFENGVMRDYQIDGFSWLLTLYENGINGILADEMGLGKTIQFIALLSHLIEQGVPGPFLVCAPLSTLPNWISEFERFAPKVPTLLYHGKESDRAEKRRLIRVGAHVEGSPVPIQPVVITSYEVVIRDIKSLSNYSWRYLCIDEGHRLKNHKSVLTKALSSLRPTNRLLLTGTPLQNSLAELWSLLNFLMPDIFDSLDVFESWFDIEDLMEEGSDERILQQERERQVISTLMKILNPFFLRRTKKDVDLTLPPKRELLVYTPMTPLQLKMYTATLTYDYQAFSDDVKNKEESVVEFDVRGRPIRKTRREFDFSVYLEEEKRGKREESREEEDLRAFFLAGGERRPLQSTTTTTTGAVGAAAAAGPQSHTRVKLQNKMMQLRRVVNHPYLIQYPMTSDGQFKIDEGVIESSGKMQVLDQLLVELHRRGHRVLLFSQMTMLLDILEDYLTLRPQFKYRRLDGRCKMEERQTDIKQFNDKNSDDFLFLISTRAGGLGLNLATADTVIIYDSDWNPQCDLQAQDRCHRIGQTSPVLVLRLITAGSVDERIVERAGTKRKLEKLIIQTGKFTEASQRERNFAKVLNESELIELLKHRDHEREHRATRGHVFTKEELDKLLDRRDLQNGTQAEKRDTDQLEGVFKLIITEED